MKRPSLLRESLEDFERNYLSDVLKRNHWNRSAGARELGISYRSLLYKIERFHLVPPIEEFPDVV